MDGLSYDDYFKKLEVMAQSLREHWAEDQRVRALKVAIQLAKLLAETSQLKLYPKKYKVITDLLDEFGQLVYIRIHSMANLTADHQDASRHSMDDHKKGNRPVSDHDQRNSKTNLYTDQQIEEQERLARARELAKDTCRNWFLKVASIRELVPRFYTELSILKTCDILVQRSQPGHKVKTTTEDHHLEEQLFSQSLRRLTKAAWGLGDPIVALHARAYLCRVASNRLIGWQEHWRVDNINSKSPNEMATKSNLLFELISMNLESCVTLIYHLDTNSIMRLVRDQNVELSAYFELVSMPVQSILNIITCKYDLYKQELEELDSAEGTHNNNANFLNVTAVKADYGAHESSHTGRRAHLLSCIRETKSSLEVLLESVIVGAGKEKCSLLSRNLLLYSAFRALPADVIATKGFDLMDTLRMSYKCLSNSKHTGEADNNATNNLAPLETTIYMTLNSFLVSLDGCDLFETTQTAEMSQLKFSIAEFVGQVIDNLVAPQQEPNAPNLNYLRCFKSLLSFAYHHTERTNTLVDELLMKFLERIEHNRQYVNHYATLIDIIKILISNDTDLSQLKLIFNWKSFKKLYDLMRRDEHRLEASKWILETMRASSRLSDCRSKQQLATNTKGDICDKATIDVILKLIGDVNDSLSVLMALDDFEHLSNLVIYFLDKISIADYQEHLNFLSRCRSLIGNLNLALEYLVQRVLRLPDEFRKVERKRQVRQNYLNGCLAYAFITIPAINGASSRMNLYLQGSRMALNHMSLSLADYYLKQVMINLIEQTRVSDEKHSAILLDLEDDRHHLQDKKQVHTKQPSQKTKQLIEHANDVMQLMLTFQDHIDLKHKLALAHLIKHSFDECSSLLQSLKLLRCVDDDDDDDEHSAVPTNGDNGQAVLSNG